MCAKQFPIRSSIVEMFEDNFGDEAGAAWTTLVCPFCLQSTSHTSCTRVAAEKIELISALVVVYKREG